MRKDGSLDKLGGGGGDEERRMDLCGFLELKVIGFVMD